MLSGIQQTCIVIGEGQAGKVALKMHFNVYAVLTREEPNLLHGIQ